MLVEGNSWNVLHHGDDFNLTQVLKVSTDTVINDTVYSKIISAYDSLSANWSLAGYMREDILAQKVYYRSVGSFSKSDSIFYNFNVKVNDSVIISVVDLNHSNLPIHDYYYTYNKVDSIDSIYIEGVYHKRIFVNYTDGIFNWGQHVWIEGVGGSEGLLTSSLVSSTIDPTQLLCFFKNDSLTFKGYTSGKYSDCFYCST